VRNAWPQPAVTNRAAKNPSRPDRRGSSPQRWQGRVRRSPEGVRHSASPPISQASIATRRTSDCGRNARVDLRLALLRFQRAGAIDEEAARLRQRDRLVEKLRLQPDELRKIARPLDPGDVGMAADGACRGARRVQENRIERRRIDIERVGNDDLRMKPEPLEIGGEHLEPLGRAVDRRPRSPRRPQAPSLCRPARRRDRRRASPRER